MSDGNEGFSSDDEQQVYTQAVNSRNTNKTPDGDNSYHSLADNGQGKGKHKRGRPFCMFYN